MSRMEIQHPTNDRLRAVIGFNRTRIGWWVEVWQGKKQLVDLDGLCDPPATPNLIIETLIAHGFFTWDDVNEAYRVIPYFKSDQIEDPEIRRAAEVVEFIKQAGGE